MSSGVAGAAGAPGAPGARARSTVIVGAGSAGAALAARLSEDPSHVVILLEAGSAPLASAEFPAELLDGGTVQGALPGHPANWSYPALLAPGRPYSIACGRIAGGSSTINGGYFVRARPADFDRWADAAGPEWRYERVLPLLRDLERDLDFGAGPFHGDAGPMPVRRAAQSNPAARAFTAAALELGFAAEPDKNAPGPSGVGPVPRNVVDGVRVNTALAYLVPALGRANLKVVGGCRVLRVVFDGKRAVGVEVTDAATANERGATADGIEVDGAPTADGRVLRGRERRIISADEVVLCAGAIATPHLLLLSGVGPAEQLQAVGIPVVRDAVGVGRAFSDHPQLSVGWTASRDLVDPLSPETFTTALNIASPVDGQVDDLEIMASVTTNDRLLTGSPGSEPRELALLVGLMDGESRGTITLESTDPLGPPRIDYRYLSTPSDRDRMRRGIRTAIALLRTSAFAPLVERLTGLDDTTLDQDGALDAWVLANLGTAIHASGSAPMGGADDPTSVVDGFGRVQGVAGLRIADTSMLPTAPSRGPAATAVLIGELVARFIRRGD